MRVIQKAVRRQTENKYMTYTLDRISAYDLQALSAVAETGSFHRAAKRLAVGQSAISRRIQNLEELTGVSLFERSSTGATLTGPGRRFLSSSLTILADLEAALSQAQQAAVAKEGCLRIGSTLSFSNGAERRLIEAFRTDHPHVDVEFFESTRQEMLVMLSHRELDVVFTSCAPINENGDGIVLDREMVFLGVSHSDALANNDLIPWRALRDVTILTSYRDAGPDVFKFLLTRLSQNGRSPKLRQLHLSREALMVLVGLGLGVTVVGNHATGVEYPNVQFIPVGDPEERIPFSITWRSENDNPALRRFISLARIEAKRNGVLA